LITIYSILLLVFSNIMSKVYTSKVIRKGEIAEETISISVERPPSFEFEAGQYVQLGVEAPLYPDPKGSSRVFSIASSPLNKNELEIAFRNTGSGFKKTLFELRVGSPVLLEGPFGHFVLPAQKNLKHIFIAGGIGITPFLSIIETVVNNKEGIPINLLYANRSTESTAFLKKLEKLEKDSDCVNVDFIVGRIEAQHLEKHILNLNDTIWWIVGPPTMVTEVSCVLQQIGVLQKTIRTEAFIGY